MEQVKTTMDPEAAGVEDSAKPVTDSNEILQSDKEVMDNTEPTLDLNGVVASDSLNDKADNALQDAEVGTSPAHEEPSSAVESVSESELVCDDSSKALEVESTKCLTEAVEGGGVDEKSSDDVASCEKIQEKVEVTTSLQETRTISEIASVQQQSTSVTETVSKFTSEESSTQVVKQTSVASSQESTITQTMDSLTTETDLKVNGNENLLDPDKVSELRRSPYYDSLIANRISMESEGVSSKTVQKEEQSVAGSNAVMEEKLSDGVLPAEQETSEVISLNQTEMQTSGSSPSQSDSVSKGVSSLKEACQETVNASPQINRTVTPGTGMFKVTKFEAKSFSEIKSNSEWTYNESSLFKSGESVISSHQASDVSSTSAEQVQSTEDMGVPPANEDVPFRFSPNAYKPPPEDEMDFVDLPRKKKMFSSSSFYEEPNAIYPTVEEQVELCRKIADSLSDDSNKKSKGANMFFKRVKKAEKWAVESIGTGYDSEYYESSRSESVSTPDPSKAPYVRVSKGPPQLRLILDPRHLLDMKRLRQEGVNIVEHNAVSPEICLDLVKDLNSPTGRGAQLFAKRKKKSEEWVVDEEKVRQLLRERESGYTSSPEPPTTIPCGADIEPMVFPRVQMVKTPWAAAMESPIGSCAGAFKELHPNQVAESVIRAAETKVMTYPTPVRPVIEPVIQPEYSVQNYPSSTVFAPAANEFTPAPAPQSHPPKIPRTTSFKVGVYTADPYKPRAPKGWTGTSPGGSQFFSIQPSLPAVQEPVQHQPLENLIQQGLTPSMPSSKLTHQPSLARAYSFTNFNKTPRAWNEAATSYQNVYIKPVKPPSVLVQ